VKEKKISFSPASKGVNFFKLFTPLEMPHAEARGKLKK
jgi:hypothetical protein